jgi:3-oxoacyl-[acyl-carrier protein] reductase
MTQAVTAPESDRPFKVEQRGIDRGGAGDPLGRTGSVADVVVAVRYLASPEASFVTGEILHVNGGRAFGR